MSKWMDGKVSIKQIIADRYCIYGLGSDGRVYRWSDIEGWWAKNWTERDKPKEIE